MWRQTIQCRCADFHSRSQLGKTTRSAGRQKPAGEVCTLHSDDDGVARTPAQVVLALPRLAAAALHNCGQLCLTGAMDPEMLRK